MTRRLTPSEHELQVGIVNWIRWQHPELRFYAVPNGGDRKLVEAKRLKDEGVTAGVPDLAFVLPDGRAAFIEVKTPRGVLSKDQIAFRDWAEAAGVPWALARNLDDAIAAIRHFLSSGPTWVDGQTGGGVRAPASLPNTVGASRVSA